MTLPGGERMPVWRERGPAGAPSLILVHGLGVTGWINWSRNIERLAQDFDVITFDLRGHGQGPRSFRFTFEQCADDIVAIADALGIGRFLLAGYSMGGPIALLCWRRHRDRVAGLVLAASAAEFVHRINPKRIRTLLRIAQSFLLLRPRWFRGRIRDWAVYRLGEVLEPARLERELQGHRFSTILKAAAELADFSAVDWLVEIDVPVAVVVTAQDDRVRPEAQRDLARRIPGASVFETPGTHAACITAVETFAPTLHTACVDVSGRTLIDAMSA